MSPNNLTLSVSQVLFFFKGPTNSVYRWEMGADQVVSEHQDICPLSCKFSANKLTSIMSSGGFMPISVFLSVGFG